jgi:hypothetical protein
MKCKQYKDLNKPVSNATQTALDLKASIAGLDLKAPLNSPASQER